MEKVMMKVVVIGAVLAGVVMIAACSAPDASAPATVPSKMKVVATFSIVGDLVRNVAGEKVELTTLVGPDADVHDFEPAPSDIAKLGGAQLIFEIGEGLENWLGNIVQSSATKATRVLLTKGLALREHDPHVWQDAKRVVKMTAAIRDALVQADPANATAYRQNAAAYVAQIEAMDKEIEGIVEQLPAGRRKLVTSHDALGYFAERYGFEVVGSVIASMSTETGEPSAQDIARLVDGIRQEGVRAIFLEGRANPKLVERVASEAGVVIGPELYTDALGPAGSPGASYIDAMKYNARAIVDALK